MNAAEMKRVLDALVSSLAVYGLNVSPAEGDDAVQEGPAYWTFRLLVSKGTRPRDVLTYEEEIRYHLGLDRRAKPLIYVADGAVVVQVPKPEKYRTYVSCEELHALFTADPEALQTPLGTDALGKVVALDLTDATTPHLLVGGATGSGKSVALDTVLGGLVANYPASHLRLHLVDPKGTELTHYAGAPHTDTLVVEANEAVALLDDLCADMAARYRKFRENGVRSLRQYNRVAKRPLPYRVVVIDEVSDLIMEIGTEVKFLLTRLTQKARAAGIHLILATQKPSGDLLPTSIRANLPAALALRVRSHHDSRVIMQEAGAEGLGGNGDAFFATARDLTRIQVGMWENLESIWSDDEAHEVVELLTPPKPPEEGKEAKVVVSLPDTEAAGAPISARTNGTRITNGTIALALNTAGVTVETVTVKMATEGYIALRAQSGNPLSKKFLASWKGLDTKRFAVVVERMRRLED
jgi:DNA segregation ATPase FtsK/SpoIIIE, S-DNA-T family